MEKAEHASAKNENIQRTKKYTISSGVIEGKVY